MATESIVIVNDKKILFLWKRGRKHQISYESHRIERRKGANKNHNKLQKKNLNKKVFDVDNKSSWL